MKKYYFLSEIFILIPVSGEPFAEKNFYWLLSKTLILGIFFCFPYPLFPFPKYVFLTKLEMLFPNPYWELFQQGSVFHNMQHISWVVAQDILFLQLHIKNSLMNLAETMACNLWAFEYI